MRCAVKSNKNYKPLSEPTFLVYLICMAAFAVAALYRGDGTLAAAEGAVIAVLVVVALVAAIVLMKMGIIPDLLPKKQA